MKSESKKFKKKVIKAVRMLRIKHVWKETWMERILIRKK